jgi:alcohol dehydrogenase YqhD (iron-dependent ADH family)
MEQLNFSQVEPNPRPEDLEQAAETIRTSLRELGIGPGSA